MSDGFFRLPREEDLEELVSLTAQSLDFSRYCDTKEKCLAFGRGFVLLHLAESNFAEVYEEKGMVSGVLLGTIRKASLLFRQSLAEEGRRQYLIAFGPGEGNSLYSDTCLAMKKESGISSFLGEITLLSLRPQLRGKGLAKKMIKHYLSRALLYGKEKVYLFSDTDCDYAFYPHVGFEKRGEREIVFDLKDGKEAPLTCFLFVADPRKLIESL